MGVSEEMGGYRHDHRGLSLSSRESSATLSLRRSAELFHITEPVAKGIAIGSASHAIGTTKAMEMGEVEGAMSSLAIAVSGLCTVLFASVFANFL